MDDVVRELRARTRGEVLEPRHAGYEAARAAYNAMATGRPAVILRPADEPDIVAAVRLAVEADLLIGVRGGGHSVAGHSSPEGALLVDLSRWRGATVDPGARTADALAGSKLMDLDAATSAYGLAAPSGTFSMSFWRRAAYSDLSNSSGPAAACAAQAAIRTAATRSAKRERAAMRTSTRMAEEL